MDNDEQTARQVAELELVILHEVARRGDLHLLARVVMQLTGLVVVLEPDAPRLWEN